LTTKYCDRIVADCGDGKGKAALCGYVLKDGSIGIASAKIYYSWVTSTSQTGSSIAISGSEGYFECWTPCYTYNYTVTITIEYVEFEGGEWDKSNSCFQEADIPVNAP